MVVEKFDVKTNCESAGKTVAKAEEESVLGCSQWSCLPPVAVPSVDIADAGVDDSERYSGAGAKGCRKVQEVKRPIKAQYPVGSRVVSSFL